MKLINLISVLAMAGAFFPCYADNLSYRQAAEIASQYVEIDESDRNVKARSRIEDADSSPYYIFNDKTHGLGFVIISGKDDVNPVLGYSGRGYIDESSMPDALREMLSLVRDKHAVRGKAAGSSDEAPVPVVAPLIQTRWYQLEPYNSKLKSSRFLTGCVATAMSQIMNYHRWPERGYGKVTYDSFSPAYGKDTDGAGIMEADLSESAYDWDNMLPIYADGNWTASQSDAVGILMRDCGYAAHLQYSINETMGYDMDMATAMSENFGYDAEVHPNFGDTTPEEWLAGMKREFDNGYPVIITGQATVFGGSGHCFIADGYDSNGFIHINWGWNGDADGYFNLGMFTPVHKDENLNYSFMQYYTSLHPRKPFSSVAFNPNLVMLYDIKNKNLEHSGLTLLNESSVITADNPVRILLEGLAYVADRGFKGEFSLWLSDEKGDLIKKVWSENVDREPLGAGNKSQVIPVTNAVIAAEVIGDGVNDGKYTIIPMSAYQGMEYMRVPVLGYKGHLDVEIKNGVISVASVARPAIAVRVTRPLELPSEVRLFTTVDAGISISNDGDFIEGCTLNVKAYPTDGGKDILLQTQTFGVYAGHSVDIPLSLDFLPEYYGFAGLKAGQSYLIKTEVTGTDGSLIDVGVDEFPTVTCMLDREYVPEMRITSVEIVDEEGNGVDLKNAVIDPEKLYYLSISYEPEARGIFPAKVDVSFDIENLTGSSSEMNQPVATIGFDLDFPFYDPMPEETWLNICYKDFITGEPVLFKPESLSRIRLTRIGASSVSEVGADCTRHEVARYNLQGLRIELPVKGINIVVYSDGTVMKEVVR